MRYIKDCISLNAEHDYPLLRQVLRSGFVTHEQLFEFMQLGRYEASRSTFNWRTRRLARYGMIARHMVPSIRKTFVYSITSQGAVELTSTGEQFLVAPPNQRRNEKDPQVTHALEINNIHLSLLRADVLARWVPEIQLRSRSTSMGFVNSKVYDAIVTVRVEGHDATFALEYERTAKSQEHYRDILGKFEAEEHLDRFLYLVPSDDLLRYVSWQFRNSPRSVYFGMLADWYRRLLDTEVFDWHGHQYRPFRTALLDDVHNAQHSTETLH